VAAAAAAPLQDAALPAMGSAAPARAPGPLADAEAADAPVRRPATAAAVAAVPQGSVPGAGWKGALALGVPVPCGWL
jgi:hypothetical protein